MGEKETNNSFKAVFPWLIKEEVVRNILSGAYGVGDRNIEESKLDNDIKSTAEEKTDETFTEEQTSITAKMIDFWNDTCQHEIPIVKLTHSRIKQLIKVYNFLENSLSKWQDYCKKISSSKFLMGEASSFRASLDWCLKEENINKILEGNYKLGDRVWSKNHIKINPIKLEPKSKDPLWITIIEEFKKIYGEATTVSWLAKLDFKIFDDHSISLIADTKFISNWIEDHYLNKIKSIVNQISDGMVTNVLIDVKGKAISNSKIITSFYTGNNTEFLDIAC
jgi:hypothetical protein